MAEADGDSEGHQTTFLDDIAKAVLLERYLDLKFVDDVTELSCKRCKRVLIHHYVANCGHLFCRNCKGVLSFGEGWRCPECKEYITLIERQEVEVERRVNELMLHCPNHKYGCKIIDLLQYIPEHLKKCLETRDANLPAYYYEMNSKFDILKSISDISDQLVQLSERFNEMQQIRATDVSAQEQIMRKLDDVETIVRGSTVVTTRLQAEVAGNFSKISEIEREAKQRSDELSTQLSERHNEIHELRESLVNAQDQIVSKLNDMETIVRGTNEVTTRLQTEVAANSSRVIEIERAAKQRSDELSNQFSEQYNEIQQLRATDVNAQEQIESKLNDMETIFRATTEVTTGLQTEVAANSSRVTEIEREAKQRSDELSTQFSEQYNEIQQLRTTDMSIQKQMKIRLNDVENVVKGSTFVMTRLQVEVADNSSKVNEIEREAKQRSDELSTHLSERYNEIQQLRATDVHAQQQIEVKLNDMETIVTGSTEVTTMLRTEVADNSSRVTEIEREAKQRSDELSSKFIEQYNDIQELRATDVKAQEQIKIKLNDVENVVKGSTEVTTRLQTEVADNSSRVTEIEREVKQRSDELSSKLTEQYNEIQQLRTTDVSAQEQFKIKLNDVETVVKGSTFVMTRLQAEVTANCSRVTEIESEAKQRSHELSTQLSERYNEMQQLRATDVNAQEQFEIKLNDVENVVRGTTEVTTRLQTEVADNSSRVTDIEREAQQRSRELSTQLSEQYNEIKQLRANDMSTQEQIQNKLNNMETIVRGTTEVTTRIQTEMAANSSRVTDIEREAKQRSHELSTQFSEQYNEIQQLRTTDHHEQEQIKIKLDDVDTIVRGSTVVTTRLQAEVAANFSKISEIESEAKQRSHELSTQLSEVEMKQSEIKATLIEKIENLDYIPRKDLQGQLDKLAADIKCELRQSVDEKTTNQMGRDPHYSKNSSKSTPFNSQNLNANTRKEYNILLTGTTGVGKSTFVNAFANYLSFESMDEAVKNDLKALIPTQFSIPDENYQQKTVHCGSDSNEDMNNKDQSTTQSSKAYEFPMMEGFLLRIIDTPGIGDTRGIDQDQQNVRGILDFLSNYADLYAICILLKPNEARLTPLFSFCIKQLLSRLHASASNNIVFIFTNSRTTFYRPGDTATPLATLLDKIRSTAPYPNIPYGKDNVYCLDNEAFRFLVALQNGIRFGDDDRNNYGQSWTKSVEAINCMIRYIVEGSDGQGLTPHHVKDTLIINQTRDTIMELAKPISELTKYIQSNLQAISKQKIEIQSCKNNVNKLKTLVYMPAVKFEITDIRQPRTVCTGEKCRELIKIGNDSMYHYPKICHNPCYLNEVPGGTVGANALQHCRAFQHQTGKCFQCGCHYSKHLHICYESKLVTERKFDPNVANQLQIATGIQQAAQDMVKNLEAEIKIYEDEKKILTESTAKLAVFLKHNAMVVCNDEFKEYLMELIEKEESISKSGASNAALTDGLRKKLRDYEQEKSILDIPLKNTNSELRITIEDVNHIFALISNMKKSGVIFRTTVEAQIKAK